MPTHPIKPEAITLSHSLPKPNTCRNNRPHIQRLFMVHQAPFHLCDLPASAAEESCMHLAQEARRRWANGSHSSRCLRARGEGRANAEETEAACHQSAMCLKKLSARCVAFACMPDASALLTPSSGSWNRAPKKPALSLPLHLPLRLWCSIAHHGKYSQLDKESAKEMLTKVTGDGPRTLQKSFRPAPITKV